MHEGLLAGEGIEEVVEESRVQLFMQHLPRLPLDLLFLPTVKLMQLHKKQAVGANQILLLS